MHLVLSDKGILSIKVFRKFVIIDISYNGFSSEQEYPAPKSAAIIAPADVPATRSHS